MRIKRGPGGGRSFPLLVKCSDDCFHHYVGENSIGVAHIVREKKRSFVPSLLGWALAEWKLNETYRLEQIPYLWG
jgi:hypothetical protein